MSALRNARFSLLARLIMLGLVLGIAPIWAEPESIIKPEDKNVLKDVYKVFQDKFKKEPGVSGVQFAVLYYGSADLDRSIDFPQCVRQTQRVFLLEPLFTFQPNQCKYIAGALGTGTKNKHTEKIVLWSFRKSEGQDVNNYDLARCPDSGVANENIYLFTYHSPCTKCVDTIGQFINGCGTKFDNLIIGYVEPWKDEAQSIKKITAMKKAAMTRLATIKDDVYIRRNRMARRNKNRMF